MFLKKVLDITILKLYYIINKRGNPNEEGKDMKFTMNGKRISKKEAYEEIARMIPNGGTRFLDNVIANSRKRSAVCGVTLTIGDKGTLKIEF